MKKDRADTFNKKIYECQKHIEKLHNAKEYLQDIMPLTVESYQNIDKIESSFIDQLIFRFSKLQDTIGESILRGILIKSKENVEKMTFIDILNKLEKLDVLNKYQWLELREVRNEIAHEYSYNPDEVVDNINLVYKKSDELIEIYHKLHKFIIKITEANNA